MPPVNVLNLDTQGLKQFLASFEHVFSDCDGVIWELDPIPGSGKFFDLMREHKKTVTYVSNNSMRNKKNYEHMFKAAGIEDGFVSVIWELDPIPGSGKFFDLMREHKKTVTYVSNNSMRNKKNYEHMFKAAGIEDGFDNLTTPAVAIAEYLKSLNFNKKVYCVASVQTIMVLEANGFKCEYGPEIGVDYYEDYIQYTENDEEIGAVVFDGDFQVNLAKMYKARTYLEQPDVLFISGLTEKSVILTHGRHDIGPGIFTELVQHQVQREPIQIGKPGKTFGELVMKRAGVTDPSTVLFIGDMIDQDISLGKAIGFKTMLVLTSHSEEEMMEHHIQPDFYATSIGSLVPIGL